MICRRQAKCHNNGRNEKSIPEHYKQHLVEKVLIEKMLMEYPLNMKCMKKQKISFVGKDLAIGGRGVGCLSDNFSQPGVKSAGNF